MTVKLTGRSAKGKQRVKEWGPLWRVVRAPQTAICFGGRVAVGLVSVAEEGAEFGLCKSGRWVEVTDDHDFFLDIA